MGQHISLGPVVHKETERAQNDRFNVAVSSCQGWRSSQEDDHTLMLNLPNKPQGPDVDAAFFAVFDGHGSAKVSKYAADGLWKRIMETKAYGEGDYCHALKDAFLEFDKDVRENCDSQLAGTTAVCILIVDDLIYCANIGDSRGVACIDCNCMPLSEDHKPDNPSELKRIMAAGGYVLGNRVNGNLALSRAFGDFHYKGNESLPAQEQMVSPYPDVAGIELDDSVDFLLLACDGIWDVLSSQEVVEFVISRLEDNMEPGLICEQLTTRCIAADYELVIGCDNMTVLLICYTRGRSWADYCTDIFNKNSARLGLTDRPRFKETPSETTTIDPPLTQLETRLFTPDNYVPTREEDQESIENNSDWYKYEPEHGNPEVENENERERDLAPKTLTDSDAQCSSLNITDPNDAEQDINDTKSHEIAPNMIEDNDESGGPQIKVEEKSQSEGPDTSAGTNAEGTSLQEGVSSPSEEEDVYVSSKENELTDNPNESEEEGKEGNADGATENNTSQPEEDATDCCEPQGD